MTRELAERRNSWPSIGPREVSKGAIGLRHLVHILFLLHRFTIVFTCQNKLIGQTARHRRALLRSRRFEQPAERQSETALGRDFVRDLIVSATDSTRAKLGMRPHVLERFF